MNLEKISLPEDNELPLSIKESEKHAQGADSTVWKVRSEVKKEGEEVKERTIALKQVRTEFSDLGELKKSKNFYDYLKQFPEFGKFVPDTLFFQAQVKPDVVGGYMIQNFSEGRSIDSIKEDELYKDPVVVQQLLDFARASVEILKKTREDKLHKPDFGVAAGADRTAILMGNYLLNPRYSTNVVIADKPNEQGQRVFFVDTGINVDQRINQKAENMQREIVGRIQEIQLSRWVKKLEGILASKK